MSIWHLKRDNKNSDAVLSITKLDLAEYGFALKMQDIV